MSLQEGSSKTTVQKNIGQLLRDWKLTGRLGLSKPKTEKQAKKQAAAIAYAHAKKTTKKVKNPLVEALRG